jgi:hypothetical protein
MEGEVMKHGEDKGQEEDGNGAVPEHVQGLYEEGCKELSEEGKRELKELLKEYGDVFAVSDLDMGKTGLIQHTIDTAGAHPVKQRMRRVPLHI